MGFCKNIQRVLRVTSSNIYAWQMGSYYSVLVYGTLIIHGNKNRFQEILPFKSVFIVLWIILKYHVVQYGQIKKSAYYGFDPYPLIQKVLLSYFLYQIKNTLDILAYINKIVS